MVIHVGPTCFMRRQVRPIQYVGSSAPKFCSISYLGTYIISHPHFKCSVTQAKKSFHRSINTIFGKVGRVASEEVILHLVKTKCFPILLYGLECYPLNEAATGSVDFAVRRFLMKMFRTVNMDVINEFRLYFDFMLPSELLVKRTSGSLIVVLVQSGNVCVTIIYFLLVNLINIFH